MAKYRSFICNKKASQKRHAFESLVFLMHFLGSVAKSIKVVICSIFVLLMLTGSVAKMNKRFCSVFLFFCFLFLYSLLSFSLFLSTFSCIPPPPLPSPPNLVSPSLLVPEMDMGLPGEDSSVNALCCQINTSFTKPSDELFSDPSLSTNGPPACTVPPVLPPPPAPMQGKHGINRDIVFHIPDQNSVIRKLFIHYVSLYPSSHFFMGTAGASTPFSSPSFSGHADAEWTQAHTFRG